MPSSAETAGPAADDHEVQHYTARGAWLRAAVLGANDGVLSTGSLMAGVAAASVTDGQLVLTGVAGIVAGALSMAAGEYVSVGSQADSEAADLRRERHELERHPKAELRELAMIYEDRGLSPETAMQVAHELMERDALGAHARDELGITEHNSAHPVQAAAASAVSFIAGGLAPVAAVLVWHGSTALAALSGVTLLVLALLGMLGAWAGGAPMLRGTVRVVLLGAAAMAVSGLVGHWFQARI